MDSTLKKNIQDPSKLFCCEPCNFTTIRLSQYTKHLTTRKHQMITDPTFYQQVSTQKASVIYNCNCGKTYKERTGLWRHKQKCDMPFNNFEEEKEKEKEKEETTPENKDVLQYLIKENNEFKYLLLQQNKIIAKLCEKNESPNFQK